MKKTRERASKRRTPKDRTYTKDRKSRPSFKDRKRDEFRKKKRTEPRVFDPEEKAELDRVFDEIGAEGPPGFHEEFNDLVQPLLEGMVNSDADLFEIQEKALEIMEEMGFED